ALPPKRRPPTDRSSSSPTASGAEAAAVPPSQRGRPEEAQGGHVLDPDPRSLPDPRLPSARSGREQEDLGSKHRPRYLEGSTRAGALPLPLRSAPDDHARQLQRLLTPSASEARVEAVARIEAKWLPAPCAPSQTIVKEGHEDALEQNESRCRCDRGRRSRVRARGRAWGTADDDRQHRGAPEGALADEGLHADGQLPEHAGGDHALQGRLPLRGHR